MIYFCIDAETNVNVALSGICCRFLGTHGQGTKPRLRSFVSARARAYARVWVCVINHRVYLSIIISVGKLNG